MTVQELLAYLNARRGIAAEVVVERSPDGRAYGRFIEDGVPWPKETTFAIRLNGNVFDLAFFKTYHGAVNKVCDAVIYANLPPAERRAMGYGPASPVPGDAGGHTRYAAVINALDVKLRGGATTSVIEPQGPEKQTAPAAGLAAHAVSPQMAVQIQRPALSPVNQYFETEDGEKYALEACSRFLQRKGWPVEDRLRLYGPGRLAFSPDTPAAEALRSFDQIWDELASGWQVFRPSGPGWAPDKMFETMKAELVDFRWGGPVTLLNFLSSGIQTALLVRLRKFRELKQIDGFPVMTVSKFSHPYNPELFPIYDNAVIKAEVLPHFRTEFRAFCLASNWPHIVGNSAEFYVSYIRWGSHLLGLAHPGFMGMFAAWLGQQPGANLAQKSFDASRLFATAFEFTIMGAWAHSKS